MSQASKVKKKQVKETILEKLKDMSNLDNKTLKFGNSTFKNFIADRFILNTNDYQIECSLEVKFFYANMLK